MSDEEKMFRYLLKYVGKYRVLTELTADGDYVRDEDGDIAPDYDELYIPCAYDGKIKHTYTDSVLAYFTDKKSTYKKVVGQLEEKRIEYNIDDSEEEFIIYFNDVDMNKVAKIVGAQTKGKKVSPLETIKKSQTEKKEKTEVINYKIPINDLQLYYRTLSPIKNKEMKKAFKNTITDSFVQTLSDRFFYTKRDKMQMTTQEYIHYIGKWKDYIKYIKEKIKSI